MSAPDTMSSLTHSVCPPSAASTSPGLFSFCGGRGREKKGRSEEEGVRGGKREGVRAEGSKRKGEREGGRERGS